MVVALVLTGAPGAGKSSVLQALGTLLEIDGVEYGAIESEQLAWGAPLLPAREWTPQLDAVLALQRQAGRQRFLVAATAENADELRAVVEATRARRVLVVCLSASEETIARRISGREPDAWPGKPSLLAHARRLARSIPALPGIDLVLDTDGRRPEDVAGRICEAMRDRGLIAADAR